LQIAATCSDDVLHVSSVSSRQTETVFGFAGPRVLATFVENRYYFQRIQKESRYKGRYHFPRMQKEHTSGEIDTVYCFQPAILTEIDSKFIAVPTLSETPQTNTLKRSAESKESILEKDREFSTAYFKWCAQFNTQTVFENLIAVPLDQFDWCSFPTHFPPHFPRISDSFSTECSPILD
jgi:hypothetical protein